MMRTSWALRGRLQYILVNGLLQKKNNNDNEMKREEPKGDEYTLMKAHEGEMRAFVVNGSKPMKQKAKSMRGKGVIL